jgi:hypothetical protein
MFSQPEHKQVSGLLHVAVASSRREKIKPHWMAFLTVCRYLIDHFVEAEPSLSCPQHPMTRLYCDPTESNHTFHN